MLISFSVAMIKHTDKKQPEGETFSLPYSATLQSVTGGSHLAEFVAADHITYTVESQRDSNTYILVFSLFSLFLYKIPCVGNGATHSGWVFPPQLI